MSLPARDLPEPDSMSPKAKGRGSPDGCLVCGRRMRESDGHHMVQMRSVPYVVIDPTDTEDSQGFFPVGSGCLKSNPWMRAYAIVL